MCTLLTHISMGGSRRRIVHFPSLTNFVNTQFTLLISCNISSNNTASALTRLLQTRFNCDGQPYRQHTLKKLVPETCMKNLTQVHHSFFHKNNWPANQVAWFASRTGQFLCKNRAVLYCVQETGTRTCARLNDTRASFLYQTTCTSFW